MDNVFLNLVRGNRIASRLGLVTPNNNANLKFGPQYAYVEIPVKEVLKDGVPVEDDKISRNQHVQIVADCSINPKGTEVVLVAYNNELQQVANLSFGHLVHPGEGLQEPSFWATFRKDCLVEDIKWAVRLSLFR